MTEENNGKPRQRITKAMQAELDQDYLDRFAEMLRTKVQAIIAKTQARERQWRNQQPGQDAASRSIRKAERRIERRLLTIMEQELNARRRPISWPDRELKQLAAEYRRLKAGQGVTGITTGNRKPPPPSAF